MFLHIAGNCTNTFDKRNYHFQKPKSTIFRKKYFPRLWPSRNLTTVSSANSAFVPRTEFKSKISERKRKKKKEMKLPVRDLHFGELWPVTSFTREREREREKLSTPNVKVSRAFGSCWRSSGRSSARQDWYSTVINSTDFEGKQLRASFRYHLGILRQASPDFYAISRRNPILSPAQTGIAFYPAFYGFPIIKSIAESLGESPEYPKALAARWLLAIELAADTEIFSGSVCVCVEYRREWRRSVIFIWCFAQKLDYFCAEVARCVSIRI